MSTERTETMLNGRYVLGARLASHEKLDVHHGEDTRGGRAVMIVFFRVQGASDRALTEFDRRASALYRLSHPGIASILSFGLQGGRPYIVSEASDARALDEMLEEGRLPFDRALRISGQVLEALEAAHAADMVHGALAASSIEVTRDGRARIADLSVRHLLAALREEATPDREGDLRSLENLMRAMLAERSEPAAPRVETVAIGAATELASALESAIVAMKATIPDAMIADGPITERVESLQAQMVQPKVEVLDPLPRESSVASWAAQVRASIEGSAPAITANQADTKSSPAFAANDAHAKSAPASVAIEVDAKSSPAIPASEAHVTSTPALAASEAHAKSSPAIESAARSAPAPIALPRFGSSDALPTDALEIAKVFAAVPVVSAPALAASDTLPADASQVAIAFAAAIVEVVSDPAAKSAPAHAASSTPPPLPSKSQLPAKASRASSDAYTPAASELAKAFAASADALPAFGSASPSAPLTPPGLPRAELMFAHAARSEQASEDRGSARSRKASTDPAPQLAHLELTKTPAHIAIVESASSAAHAAAVVADAALQDAAIAELPPPLPSATPEVTASAMSGEFAIPSAVVHRQAPKRFVSSVIEPPGAMDEYLPAYAAIAQKLFRVTMSSPIGPIANKAIARVRPWIEWLKEDEETEPDPASETSEWHDVIEATRTSPGFKNPLLAHASVGMKLRPISMEMPAVLTSAPKPKPRSTSVSLEDDLALIKPSFNPFDLRRLKQAFAPRNGESFGNSQAARSMYLTITSIVAVIALFAIVSFASPAKDAKKAHAPSINAAGLSEAAFTRTITESQRSTAQTAAATASAPTDEPKKDTRAVTPTSTVRAQVLIRAAKDTTRGKHRRGRR